MLKLISKLPAFTAFYKFHYPKLLPPNLTINITYKCNQRCLTCNIWQVEKEELKAHYWEKIVKSISKSVYFLTLTGGEVFLKEDLITICELINEYIQPKILTIPTNAYNTLLIINQVEKLVKIFNNTRLILNLSLDGVGELHNKIRNKPDAFTSFMQTYNELKKINHNNFIIGIATCISKYNIDKLTELIEFVINELKPHSFVLEPAQNRYELNTKNENFGISYHQYSKIVDRLLNLQPIPTVVTDFNLHNNSPSPLGTVTAGFSLRNNKNLSTKLILKLKDIIRKEYYRTLSEVLKNNNKVINCYAGFASCHIMPDGEVLQCCIKNTSFGNLKDYDYNFKKLWLSEYADKLRKRIKNENCYCTLANVFYTNYIFNMRKLLKLCFLLLFQV